jgi:hypothetical protein
VKNKSNSRFSGLLVLLFLIVGTIPSHAAIPYAYEPMTGTDGMTMDQDAGSSSSNGFVGPWNRVQATKSPTSASSLSTYFKTNVTFAYPTNSRYTVPSANSAAGSTWSVYDLSYTARRLVNPISFDTPGTYYMSFLMNVAGSANSHGSAMVGLIETLTTSSSDSVPQSLLVGYTYTTPASWAIDYQAANAAVWNDSAYDASNGTAIAGNASGSSWFVLAKFTIAASGNDRVQMKGFAPSDTLPASDSSITWSVDYSTPITGVMKYAALQLEFQSAVDDLRFATNYANAVGLPEAPTLGSPSLAGTIYKGIISNIQMTTNSAGKVRFLVDGKRIPGCLSIPTTGTSPNFTATCPWKPPVSGMRALSAQFTSLDSLYTDAFSSSTNVMIRKRTNVK